MRKTRFAGVKYAFMAYLLHTRRLQRDTKYFRGAKSFWYNAWFLESMLAMLLQPLMAWLFTTLPYAARIFLNVQVSLVSWHVSCAWKFCV